MHRLSLGRVVKGKRDEYLIEKGFISGSRLKVVYGSYLQGLYRGVAVQMDFVIT
jgi:hypothetical protein